MMHPPTVVGTDSLVPSRSAYLHRPPRSSVNSQLLRPRAHLAPTARQCFLLTTFPSSSLSSGGLQPGTPESYPELGLVLLFLPLLLSWCTSLRQWSPELCLPRLQPCQVPTARPGALPVLLSPLLSPPSYPGLSLVPRLLSSVGITPGGLRESCSDPLGGDGG